MWGRTTYIINSGSVIIVLWFHGFTTKTKVKPPKRPQKLFLWSEGGLGTFFGVFLWSKFGHEKGHSSINYQLLLIATALVNTFSLLM